MKQKFFFLSLFVLTALSCQTLIPSSAPTQPAPVPISTNTPLKPTAAASLDSSIGAAGVGDSLYPEFGNGGYDALSYRLEILVKDVKTSELNGKTTMIARATQNLSRFNLDLSGFKVVKVTVNGADARFERDGQELTIIPAQELKQGAEFAVVVEYAGVPKPMMSKALYFPTGWIVFEKGIYVLSEPDGAATFFPSNDHPLDKANYEIVVTVPKPYEVAANGILEEETDNGDSTTYSFKVRDPMASYLTTINIADFDVETSTSAGGVPIRNYFDASLSKDYRQAFARQGEMIDYFSELFGAYPFEVYGALMMNQPFGAALENQTLSIFGSDMIYPDSPESSELVVAHELTHQWFGDSVSVAQWRDIWLNEGFASYGEALWTEHLYGASELNAWAEGSYNMMKDNAEYFSPPGSPAADDLFNYGVYQRGGLTLHALRLTVGDQAFFKILKTYAEKYKYGNATTEDFIAVAEQVSGQALGDFFQNWLYEKELPPLPK
ncbi:MAG: M1 family metallopeptidase [Anaerolineales bacterium]|nr:M1 family metallopeptidase [Anaerolineales bacterium]